MVSIILWLMFYQIELHPSIQKTLWLEIQVGDMVIEYQKTASCAISLNKKSAEHY